MLPLALLAAVVATAVCVAVGIALTPALRSPAEAAPVETVASVETTVVSDSVRPRAIQLVRAWDARRAEAWAHGDLRLLARLYAPGSAAGRRDVAMLREWTARGLVVKGLTIQLLEVRTLRHSVSRWSLLVTDRLVGGVAVGHGVRRPLPRDEPTTVTVRLLRAAGVWRVASVRPAATAG
jgi:hypothetical protein